MTMAKKTLDKAAAAALFKMGNVPHKRPPKPSVKEMNRKFKMSTDRKGNPVIREAG